MIYENTKELLAEIKRIMDLNDIQQKDLCVLMNKSQQSVSQIFKIKNPKCNTLFEICNALNLQLDINFIQKKEKEF